MKRSELALLREKSERKRHLEAIIPEMKRRRSELEERTAKLEKKRDAEQHDVDALRDGSFAAFLYDLVGKKDEKLSKEKAEALKAEMDYRTALGELESLSGDIAEAENELSGLDGAGEIYAGALLDRVDALMAQRGEAGEKLFAIEGENAKLRTRIKELQEAADAGDTALATARSVADCLDKAENWGLFDIAGGGVISGLQKHSYLSDAQSLMQQLETDMRRFDTEMGDVELPDDVDIPTGGSVAVIDVFFDSFIVDFMVQSSIEKALSSVQDMISRLEAVISRLNDEKNSVQAQCAENEKKIALIAESEE